MTLAPQPIDSPQAEEPEIALAGPPGRAVDLDVAIMKFSQHGETIVLSLMPNDYGQRVLLQDPEGDLFEISVSPGQSNIVAELPDSFAPADTLTIRVD